MMKNRERMVLWLVFGYVGSEMLGLSNRDCINVALMTASVPAMFLAFELFDLLKKKLNGLKK